MVRVPAFQAGYAGSIPVTRSRRHRTMLCIESSPHPSYQEVTYFITKRTTYIPPFRAIFFVVPETQTD